MRWTLAVLMVAGCDGSTAGEEAAGGANAGAFGKSDGVGSVLDSQPSLFRVGDRNGWTGSDPFYDTIQPILAQRCVVCHGCTDSPCQLKLTSYEGIRRGSSPLSMFEPRFYAVKPSPLESGRVTGDNGLTDFDATERNWRGKGFYSVTEHADFSAMSFLVAQGFENPEPTDLKDEWKLFNQGADGNEWACLDAENVGPDGPPDDKVAARGMPFGLQPLDPKRYETLINWLALGAPPPTPEAQALLATPTAPETVAKWEAFLNQDTPQAQQAARYIYEHTFFAHIYFPANTGEFFQMVRSRTPPGEPIDQIATKRITSDPGVARPFYRLLKVTDVIVQKQHMTWRFDDALLERWDDLFLSTRWDDEVAAPVYEGHNPFVTFKPIPSRIRNRFMIENSYHFIDAMVRGDVCIGSAGHLGPTTT